MICWHAIFNLKKLLIKKNLMPEQFYCQPACPDFFGELVEGGLLINTFRLGQAANDKYFKRLINNFLQN